MSSAHVNLTSETAIVSPAPEEKTGAIGLKQLGEELAQHLTTCGFASTLRGMVFYTVVVSFCFHYGVLMWQMSLFDFVKFYVV